MNIALMANVALHEMVLHGKQLHPSLTGMITTEDGYPRRHHRRHCHHDHDRRASTATSRLLHHSAPLAQ